MRLADLEAALAEADLVTVSRIAWSEFWEMHSLFHTCSEPFTYWEPGSLEVLNTFSREWKSVPNPPIVTMDAGANVHVLVPQSEKAKWLETLKKAFPKYSILADDEGTGARFLDEAGGSS